MSDVQAPNHMWNALCMIHVNQLVPLNNIHVNNKELYEVVVVVNAMINLIDCYTMYMGQSVSYTHLTLPTKA